MKIEKLIKAYNKKAEKWGYETLSVENGKLIGEFHEKFKDDDSIFKKLITSYKDGYLKEDYEKIKKELTA